MISLMEDICKGFDWYRAGGEWKERFGGRWRAEEKEGEKTTGGGGRWCIMGEGRK